MREFPIPIPPLKLQKMYGEQIDLVLNQINQVTRNSSHDLFDSLIQKAFKGELVA